MTMKLIITLLLLGMIPALLRMLPVNEYSEQ